MVEIQSPFVRVYVDLSREVNTKLDEAATKMGMTKKAFLAMLIVEHVAQANKRSKK
jgi:hypothetical protein